MWLCVLEGLSDTGSYLLKPLPPLALTHPLRPQDPTTVPWKKPLKCSTVSTLTIHPHKPLISPLPKAILFTKQVECSRQCRAAELTGRRAAPHCAPSFAAVYTPRRKPASEPCTHRAQRARSESRFSKRQTLAVCSCRHAAVLREFQTLGEELFSSDIIINNTFGTNMSIYWTRNILQRLSAKMLFLWLNLWRICWLYESNPNPPIFEANSEILTSLWWAPSDL